MYETLHCVALRTIKHDDRTSVLSAWSAEHGRVGIVMPAGAGREARRRRALTMPLALFEGVCVSRPGRDLIQLRDLRPWAMTSSVHANPVKAAMALFLADVLDGVLRTSQPDEHLTHFLQTGVQALHALTRPAAAANFHLWFLRVLAALTGIEPDYGSWSPGAVFDMTEGVFRATPPLHGRWLAPDDALAVRMLGRLTIRSMAHVGLSREQRGRILEGIIDYYSLHGMPAASAARSLEILRTLF